MGKAARLKKVSQEAGKQLPTQGPAQSKIVNTIAINIHDDGKVTVSGPITDPVMVIDVMGAAFKALAMFHVKHREGENRIVSPGPPLILPQ